MAHDVDGERARDARRAGDLASVRPVEGLQGRVEHRRVRICGRERLLDVGVDASDDVRGQQTEQAV